LNDAAIEDAFRRFKDLADKKKHVFDETLPPWWTTRSCAAGTPSCQGVKGRDRHRHPPHAIMTLSSRARTGM